nr:MAG TPA: hypothetical protein [Caudoviricetes sp.]
MLFMCDLLSETKLPQKKCIVKKIMKLGFTKVLDNESEMW